MSASRSTVVPIANETPIEDNATETDYKEAAQEGAHKRDARLEEENVAGAPRKYAMDRITLHAGKRNNVKYVARWYGYTAAHGTVEPPTFFKHLNIRYWCRVQKPEAKQQGKRKQNRKRQGTWAEFCTDEHINKALSLKEQ